jgi:acetylglutamate kinase
VSASGPVVVKLGGNALASLPDALALRRSGSALVVVHGGGAQISALMRRRGIEPRFSGGRRITDLASLACVRKALADVSDDLAASLAAAGITPAVLRRGEALVGERVADLGLVGRIVDVETAPFRAAFEAGAVPLVAPLARDGASGRYLNVNADDVAAAVAAALGASELVFVSDVAGVLDDAGVVIPRISASAPPTVSGGMLPKLAAEAAAVAAGVGRVRIGTGNEVIA